MIKTAPNDDHQEMGVGRNKSRKLTSAIPATRTGDAAF
jgi:hypothetical protein